MFLFSVHGYWQELIEFIVWAHDKLKEPHLLNSSEKCKSFSNLTGNE